MLLSTLSVSQLLEGALHSFEDNILGPRVYEALFKAALNVVQTNALPLLATSPTHLLWTTENLTSAGE
jgi:hypothetical protein